MRLLPCVVRRMSCVISLNFPTFIPINQYFEIMFSGIIEEAAQVVKLEKEKDNLHITMKCSFVNELKIDQSISHNGVCLTVVKKDKETYTTTAIKETLDKTNLGLLKPGDKVNLERSTRLDGRLDGHMVQ